VLQSNLALAESKACFFEKKKQKTFVSFGVGFAGEAQPSPAKIFWFFFAKRTAS
jgi:hypothetical protein